MPNMENYLIYDDYQFQLVSHVLVLGFGAMVAGLVYFLVTARQVLPKYRATNYLSAVVMVSAGLILFNQYQSWSEAFVYSPVTGESRIENDVINFEAGWVNPAVGPVADADAGALAGVGALSTRDAAGRTFSNGFRYVNWTIDVPMLQIQLLAVVGLTGAAFRKNAIKFTIGGLAMVYTSYVAQFYEWGFHPAINDGEAQSMFWIFYALGWLAYLYILFILYTVVFRDVSGMPPRAQSVMKGVWRLLLVTWTVYAVAIALPGIWFNEHASITRQFLFTAADIVSKVIYGVMLGRVALYRSAAEGFLPAIQTTSQTPPDNTPLYDDRYNPADSVGLVRRHENGHVATPAEPQRV